MPSPPTHFARPLLARLDRRIADIAGRILDDLDEADRFARSPEIGPYIYLRLSTLVATARTLRDSMGESRDGQADELQHIVHDQFRELWDGLMGEEIRQTRGTLSRIEKTMEAEVVPLLRRAGKILDVEATEVAPRKRSAKSKVDK